MSTVKPPADHRARALDPAAVIDRLRAFLDDERPAPGPWGGPAGEIPAEADLIEEGYADSMELMDLVSFIEREFHLRVEEQELLPENFATLSACARFVLAKTAGREKDE